MTLPLRTFPSFVNTLGTPGPAPASGTLETRVQFNRVTGQFTLNFTLKGFRLAVTDAGASGSSASAVLWTFIKGAISLGPSRQNYTAFAEGAALTTAAGDAAFILALGSVAANAGDGALTGTEVDIAPATATLNNVGGTTTGSKLGTVAANAPLDGTTTAVVVNLNWSGTAAQIDANSTFDIWGTISVSGQILNPTEVIP